MAQYRRRLFFVLLLLIFTVSDGHTTQLRIRQVIIKSQNVFNPDIPEENKWWFQAANKLHFTTKDQVIKRELLLKGGDVCDPRLVAESERNLRKLDLFRSVSVRCVTMEDGATDLLVEVSDIWTTQIRADFGKESNETFYLLGFEETNFGGYGKNLGFFYSKFGKRLQQEFRYADPQLFGTRFRSTSLFSRWDNGEQIGFDLVKPFYALKTPYAIRLTAVRQDLEKDLYENDISLLEFRHRRDFLAVESGIKFRGNSEYVTRLKLKFEYQDDRFMPVSAPIGTLIPDHKSAGFGVGGAFEEQDFLKVKNVRKMQRAEDINLGRELDWWLMYAPKLLSSDRDRMILSLKGQDGFRLGEGMFMISQVGMDGRVSSNGLENTYLYASTNFIFQKEREWHHTLVLRGEGIKSWALDGENAVRLDGRTGLRGYRTRSFTGNAAVLGNFEYRVVHPREFLRLLYIGYAVFADVGSITYPKSRQLGPVYSDIGFGLRILPSRAASGRPWRLDVSRQLHAGTQKEGWMISMFGGYSFDLFSNSSRDLRRRPGDVLMEEDSSIRHSEY
ncbi:MAG: hypothetical protein HZB99_01045 [Candidatus Harrisonbacteria bacterium]|nr:hypothetical protein [Candidatus Harrisonbacteria bacterium]